MTIRTTPPPGAYVDDQGYWDDPTEGDWGSREAANGKPVFVCLCGNEVPPTSHLRNLRCKVCKRRRDYGGPGPHHEEGSVGATHFDKLPS
jgi:hypothetical protein